MHFNLFTYHFQGSCIIYRCFSLGYWRINTIPYTIKASFKARIVPYSSFDSYHYKAMLKSLVANLLSCVRR